MQTINTLLSQTDRYLLEKSLLSFGRVVTFQQLLRIMGSPLSRENARARTAALVHKGWLIRLKNGLYVIVTDISTLGSNDLSEYVVAQALHKDSYISFENALQYHGMFDQALRTVRSVTATYARGHQVQQLEYGFSRVKNDLYFGFSEEIIDKSYRVHIAEAEKALLDMLYLRSGKAASYTTSVVLEKLRDYGYMLDSAKLRRYAMVYGIGMVRIVGFLLDQAGGDTSDLLTYSQTHAKAHEGGYTKLAAQSDKFNAKWRLYYDSFVIT